MHLIVVGGFLRPIKSSNAYVIVASKENDSKHAQTDDESTATVSLGLSSKMINAIKHVFPPALFRNPIYMLHMLIFCFSAFVLSGWFIYLVPHAIDKGMTPYQASSISMVAAVVSLIGRIGFLPLVEKEIIQLRTAMYAGIALSTVSLLIDPWMNSFWLLMISSSMYFVGRGVYKSLFFVILNANIGADHLASGLGWCLAVAGLFRAAAGVSVGELIVI